MKSPRNSKTKVDLTVPATIADQDDCFGVEWDPTEHDCSICADIDICGIKFQASLQKRKAAYEAKSKPLDMMNFSSVDMEKIVKVVRKYQDSDPVTVEELVDLVETTADGATRDECAQFLQLNMPVHNIVLDNGKAFINDGTHTTDRK